MYMIRGDTGTLELGTSPGPILQLDHFQEGQVIRATTVLSLPREAPPLPQRGLGGAILDSAEQTEQLAIMLPRIWH